MPQEQTATQSSEPGSTHVGLTERRAFGSINRLLDMHPDDSIPVTHEDVRHITTTYITKSLYGADKLRTADKVGLNETEYGKIALNVTVLLDRAVAPVTRKYRGANEILLKEKELTRKRDVLSQLGPKHASVLADLESEVENLGKLREFARYPGMRRTTEANFRMMATDAWTRSFKNVLMVVGDRENWTSDQRAGAEQALLRALTTGPQSARIGEWKRWLTIAYDYARRRHYIFTERAQTIDTIGSQVMQELTDHLDRYGFVSY